MATKKTAKKATDKSLPFNKKNTLALADLIFSDKGGQISCMKLCEGKLSNGKDGGRTLHCAVGEAYFTFVSSNMRKVNASDSSTEMAIDALADVAQLKNANHRQKLVLALEDAVDANDNSMTEDDDWGAMGDYIVRAKEVAEVFRKKVAPLLK